MRTTLTLEADVAALLERVRKDGDASLKEIINEALRLGLAQLQAPRDPQRERYATPVESLGGCRLASLDDVAEALAFGEGEDFR